MREELLEFFKSYDSLARRIENLEGKLHEETSRNRQVESNRLTQERCQRYTQLPYSPHHKGVRLA